MALGVLCVKLIFSKHIWLFNITVKTRGKHFHSFPPGGAPPNGKKQENLKTFIWTAPKKTFVSAKILETNIILGGEISMLDHEIKFGKI